MTDERIDTFQNRLCEAMKIREINGVELAKRTGYNKANISQWVNGIYEAKQEGVYKLANALNINEAWLMGYDVPMERNLAVSEATTKEVNVLKKILNQIPFYELPVSAGTGAWLGEGHEYEFIQCKEAPTKADFALKVRGDSMEPMYSDGDIVFIKNNVMVESGQIGIFYLNDEGYLKMLQGNKLISLNDEYKPIIIEEWDSFFCAGRVIGKTRLE